MPYSSPNCPGLLDCTFSTESFLIVLFSNESFWGHSIHVTNHLGIVHFSNISFLHCSFILSKWGCVLYNKKGCSVFLSFHKNRAIMLHSHILYLTYFRHWGESICCAKCTAPNCINGLSTIKVKTYSIKTIQILPVQEERRVLIN